jgi:Fe-S oxidoreductase
VDIEHVDHILDMRRYQVLVESNFPSELNQLFKGMENKGNPWNMSPTMRMDWAKGLEFDVPVVGEDLESLESVDWLFWVGCAGAYEDRAKKTTRAVAELLDIAGVSFGVLGNGETCTGDSARRAGNEFVFQGLATQNVETFKEYKVKKVVSTCAHCFNTLKNEYKDFGIELEVVHHTQLLNRLVREGKLTPVATGEGAAKRSITYHDPCYLGRHNQVYSPPRELLQVLPGAEYVEMERNSERSFCCGAGGARMWMEETLGSRINENRTAEAVGTGADQIAVGCPFCRVMLSDGLTAAQAKGDAREEVEVLDVAQMLLASVKGEPATRAKSAPAPGKSAPPVAGEKTEDVETPEAKEAPTEEAAAAASGGSLFDMGSDDSADSADEPAAKAEPAATEEPEKVEKPAESGGSLFDLGGDEPAAKAEAKTAEKSEEKTEEPSQPEAEDEPEATSTGPADEIPSGSLFDLEAPAETPAPATASEPEPDPAAETEPDPERADEASGDPEPEPVADSNAEASPAQEAADEIPEGSLFDIAAPEPAPAKRSEQSDPEPQPEPEAESEAKDDEPEPEPAASTSEESSSEESSGGLSGGAALSQAATFAASEDEDPDTLADADADAEPTAEDKPDADAEPDTKDESEDELEEPKKKPAEKPAASGEAHQPKTDADIDGGSLFDL